MYVGFFEIFVTQKIVKVAGFSEINKHGGSNKIRIRFAAHLLKGSA